MQKVLLVAQRLRTTSALTDLCSLTWWSFQQNKTKDFKLQFTKKTSSPLVPTKDTMLAVAKTV